MSNTIKLAISCIERGWAVFPLSGGKSPVSGSSAHHDAVSDTTSVHNLWKKYPGEYVGISCAGSGLVVIDIDVWDSKEGRPKDGEQRWQEILVAAGEREPETYEVRTGSGGRHLYFRWDGPSGEVVGLTGKLCGHSSIDVKHNGYVVAGGQGKYQVIQDVKPVELPTWLLRLVAKQRRAERVAAAGSIETGPSFDAHVKRIVSAIKYADEGEGNAVAAIEAPKLGNYVAAGQLTEESALSLLYGAVEKWSWRDEKSRRAMYRTLERQLLFGCLTERAWTESAEDALIRIVGGLRGVSGESARRKYAFTELVKVVDMVSFMNQGDWERGLRGELGQTSNEFRKFINEARKRRRIESEEILDFDANSNHAALAVWVIENKLEPGRVVSWRDDMYRWTGPKWEIWEDFEAWTQELMSGLKYVSGETIRELNTNDNKVRSLCHAIKNTSTILRSATVEEDREYISLRNGLYDLKSGEISEHRPSVFNTWSLDFDYDPDARADTWDSLRARYFPSDPTAWEFLCEWIGYLLSGDTDLQTLAAFWGAAGSGKGTLTRVIDKLMGHENVASSELASVAEGEFWASSFYTKPLLVVNEADNWGQLTSKGISRIKMISGGDGISVNLKGKAILSNVVVPTRLMLVSNERPEFKDPDGALDRRTVFLHFEVGIKDRDPDVEVRLAGELSGIFARCMSAYRRMRVVEGRRKFTEPVSNGATKADIRDITQSERVFVERCLKSDVGGRIFVEDMFIAYKDMTGNTRASMTAFGRRVAAPIKDINRGAISRVTRPNDEFRRGTGKLSPATAWHGVCWSEEGMLHLSEGLLSERNGR